VLQNKNQFWRFAMVFSVVLQRQSFMFFIDSGFFTKQMDHFCKAKGLQLQGKRTTVGEQKDSFCNKMKLFCEL